MKKAYILRHGQTDWNLRRLFQGQINTDINEEGIRQATLCADKVREAGLYFDQIWSSPIRRAIHTTQIVSGCRSEDIHQDPRLMEIDFGPLDETPFDVESPLVGTLFSDPEGYKPIPGVESYASIIARVGAFFEDLKQSDAQSVLVGSHGGAIRCMLVYFGYLRLADIWKQQVGNCEIFEVTLGDDGAWHVTGNIEGIPG